MPAKSTIPIDTEIAKADAAVAHDAWFSSEVEAGLREADDPSTVWVTNTEVERRSAQRRAQWQAEIERQRKSA
jgi:hypothetical protein